MLNFGHGVFIALGAFVATSVMGGMADWTASDSLLRNLAACCARRRRWPRPARAFAQRARDRAALVWTTSRKQILVEMSGMIVGEELVKVIWGPQQIALPLPETLRGSFVLGDASIEKYRVLAVAIELQVVFALFAVGLNRLLVEVGLLIRAGVQDREMVESLGYRIRRLFVDVDHEQRTGPAFGGVTSIARAVPGRRWCRRSARRSTS